MKPLRPILRESPNERVRALLSSAQLDRPPSGWKQRTLLAMLPVACPRPVSNVSELATAKGPGASGAIAPKAATAIAAKWAVIGAIAGGSLSATVTHAVDMRLQSHAAVGANVRHAADTQLQPPEQLRVTSDASRERTAVPEVVELANSAANTVAPIERVAPSQPRPSVNHAVAVERIHPTASELKQKQATRGPDVTDDSATRSTTTSSLGDEVRSLQRIRQVSVAQSPVLALEELDRHERQYPTPGLGIETAVLRIDLLWSAGQTSTAESLAEQFLLRHPGCPHAQHVRALLKQKAARQGRLQDPPAVESTQ